jgi:hypothetical protein
MKFPVCPDCGSCEDGAEVFACENADCEHHEGHFCERCAKATSSNAGQCPHCDEYGPKIGDIVSAEGLNTESPDEEDMPD